MIESSILYTVAMKYCDTARSYDTTNGKFHWLAFDRFLSYNLTVGKTYQSSSDAVSELESNLKAAQTKYRIHKTRPFYLDENKLLGSKSK
jgi:hypothetical protein